MEHNVEDLQAKLELAFAAWSSGKDLDYVCDRDYAKTIFFAGGDAVLAILEEVLDDLIKAKGAAT